MFELFFCYIIIIIITTFIVITRTNKLDLRPARCVRTFFSVDLLEGRREV